MTPYNMSQKFDSKSSLYSDTKDPLPMVTVRLWEGKKNRATIIDGLKSLWDSRVTESMIKSRHTKPYRRNMCSNKVE